MYRRIRVALALSLLAALVPAAAWAGRTVIKGEQSLRLTEKLTPAKAGAKNTTLHFSSVYMDPKHPSQQPPTNTKSIVALLPKGAGLNTGAVAQCKQSLTPGSPGALACPAASKVGSGNVTVNARPTISSLITGSVTMFNAVDDKGGDGYPAGTPELLLYIRTSIGATVTDPFHIVKSAGRLKLIYNAAKPSKPGRSPGDLTIEKINLTVHGNGKKPYVTNPKRCTGRWVSKLTINNWFGQPSISASDQEKCRK